MGTGMGTCMGTGTIYVGHWKAANQRACVAAWHAHESSGRLNKSSASPPCGRHATAVRTNAGSMQPTGLRTWKRMTTMDRLTESVTAPR